MSDIICLGVKWLGVYAAHSTFVIVVLWLLFKYSSQLNNVTKDLLLKTALLANIVASSVYVGYPYLMQWMFANSGANNNIGTCANTQLSSQTSLPLAMLGALVGWGLVVLWLGMRLYWRKSRFLTSLYYLNTSQPSLETMLTHLAAKACIKHPIKLRFITNALSPMMLNKNTILVPEKALQQLDNQQQQSMLAHELAHIKRRDDVWLWVCQLHQVLFFFQPLNHWLIQELREVTEKICDAEAIQMTQNQQALAQCLVEVAGWLTQTPSWVAAMAARKHQLKQRIHHILNNKPMKNTRKRSQKPVFIVAGAMVIASGLTFTALSGVPSSQAQSVVKQKTKTSQQAAQKPVLHCETSVKKQYQEAVRQQNKAAQKSLQEQVRRDDFARSIFLFPAAPKPKAKKVKGKVDGC